MTELAASFGALTGSAEIKQLFQQATLDSDASYLAMATNAGAAQ
jgi:hypothetical protein